MDDTQFSLDVSTPFDLIVIAIDSVLQIGPLVLPNAAIGLISPHLFLDTINNRGNFVHLLRGRSWGPLIKCSIFAKIIQATAFIGPLDIWALRSKKKKKFAEINWRRIKEHDGEKKQCRVWHV